MIMSPSVNYLPLNFLSSLQNPDPVLFNIYTESEDMFGKLKGGSK